VGHVTCMGKGKCPNDLRRETWKKALPLKARAWIWRKHYAWP